MAPTMTVDDEQLAQVEQRMIREHPEVPPGAVLRSVARATVRARRWGCPPQYLATTVEASTRWWLAQRTTTG
jgi:hypothetical protein